MKIVLSLLAGLALPASGLALWVALTSPLAVFNSLVPVDAETERVVTAASYGPDPRQRLDVYRPVGPGNALPVIVFCYGGAWDSGDRTLYDFAGRSFAALGYLTVVFDYRLVPRSRFPDFVDDTAAAVAWASRHAADLGGDPGRIFLVGHSAGAYNVALAALDPRYLEAYELRQGSIAGVATLAGPFDFLPLDDPATIAAFAHAHDLKATQPVNAVTHTAPPFLLLTGDADTTVGPYNSNSLKRRLDADGVENRMIVYPGLGHVEVLTSLARPLRWQAPVLADIKAFFDGLQRPANRSWIAP